MISYKSMDVAHSKSSIRSMVSSIDGFQDMEIRVSIKFDFDTFSLDNKGTKNTWSKTFKAQNLDAFKSRSFCFGLLYPPKSI